MRPRVRTGGDSLGCFYRSTSESWVPSPAPPSRTKAKSRAGAPLSRWQELFEQAKAQSLKVRETINGVVDGLASGDLPKVGELHLQRQSPSSDAGRLAMPPDLGDDGLQRFAHRRERVQVLREGVFRPNRFADAVGANRPFIDAARDPVIGCDRTYRSAAEGR